MSHRSRYIHFELCSGVAGLKKELIKHLKWLNRQQHNELNKNRIEVTKLYMDNAELISEVLYGE